MSVGKIAAQCGHAIVKTMRGSNKRTLKEWIDNGEKIVTLSVKDLETMEKLKKKAGKASVYSRIIYDAGLTEVEEHTPTVCVIGPNLSGIIDTITGKLNMV